MAAGGGSCFSAGGWWIDASAQTEFHLKSMSEQKYIVTETELVLELGVDRSTIRKLRLASGGKLADFTKGEDWDFIKRKVWFTASAAKVVKSKIAKNGASESLPEIVAEAFAPFTPETPVKPASEDPAPEITPDETVDPGDELEIYQILKGGRFVRAKRPGPDGDLVEVFVGSTAKYVTFLANGERMKLRAQFDPGSKQWRRVGNAPRHRGRY